MDQTNANPELDRLGSESAHAFSRVSGTGTHSTDEVPDGERRCLQRPGTEFTRETVFFGFATLFRRVPSRSAVPAGVDNVYAIRGMGRARRGRVKRTADVKRGRRAGVSR